MKNLLNSLSILCILVLFGCTTAQKNTTPIIPAGWAKNVIWYQIFVERFNNGDTTNDPRPDLMYSKTSSPVPANWKITPWTKDWYARDDWAKDLHSFNDNLQFRRYGGDIQGIINKLDYLQDLGVTAIFLNPIYDSPSLHKYDARNYHHIDVTFGPDPQGDLKLMAQENPVDPTTWKWTSADKLFLKLVDQLHKRNMRVIMDVSWNHTGTEFWAMKDVMKNLEKSPYKDWYVVKSFEPFDFEGWLGIKSLPEIRKVNITTTRKAGHPYEGDINEGAKKHIFDCTKRWLAPDGDTTKGIDGFRLDVADQIGLGFWRDYRKFTQSIRKECYLVGEIWWEKWPDTLMNPVPFVNKDVFDAVMFYQLYRPARKFFTDSTFTAKDFADSLNFQRNRLDKAFRYVSMNVSSTHDTPRLLTCFYNPGKYKFHANPNEDKNYKTGKPDKNTYDRVKLYLVHSFTNVGAPQIWNGEEMGMWGDDDPGCRKPLWWKEMKFQPETRTNFQPVPKTYDETGFNQDVFDFYKKLIQIRKANPVLVDGDIAFLTTENKKLMYKRFTDKDEIFVIINADKQAQTFELPRDGKYGDLLTQKELNGKSVNVEPLSAMILKVSK